MWEFWTPTEVRPCAPELFAVEAGPFATLGYLLLDRPAGQAWVIDAPLGSATAYEQLARQHGVRITHILLTHSHWDHIADVAELRRLTAALVAVHPADAYRLRDDTELRLLGIPLPLEPIEPDLLLEHGQRLRSASGAWELEVRFTPGHTQGSVCFVEERRQIVFAGDTLFAGSIGRTDLPGGNFEQLLESLRTQLLPLPGEFRIYPGHGPPTTLQEELRSNPFVQAALGQKQ